MTEVIDLTKAAKERLQASLVFIGGHSAWFTAEELLEHVAINIIADTDWDRARFKVIREWCKDVPGSWRTSKAGSHPRQSVQKPCASAPDRRGPAFHAAGQIISASCRHRPDFMSFWRRRWLSLIAAELAKRGFYRWNKPFKKPNHPCLGSISPKNPA